MKHVMRGAMFVIGVLGIAACVKQVWRVTYPGPEEYSLGTAVLVTDSETSYFSGYLNDDSVFVAAYDRAGKRLWDRVLSGEGQFFVRDGGRSLVQDSAGRIHLRWQDAETRSNRLYTLDPEGNLLNAVELEDSRYLDSLHRFNDDTLYLTSTVAPVVNAYTSEGIMLWSYSPVAMPLPGDHDLGDYSGQNRSAVTAANYSASSGYSGFAVTNLVAQEGRMYFGYPGGIVELDANGTVMNTIAPADVGLDAIYETIGTGSGLMAIGEASSGVVAVLLDAGLAQISNKELVQGVVGNFLASGSGATICIAVEANTGGRPNTIQVMQLDASANAKWKQSVQKDGKTWEYTDVLASGSACYLTSVVVQQDDRVFTRTQRFADSGELTDTINLQDFVLYGMAVQGKGIYHVGITGEYDNSATLATLDKQVRK